MKTRSTRLAAGLAGLALLASACSYTREDAVNDLVDEGLPQDTAECVMDEMEGAGYEVVDLGVNVTPEEVLERAGELNPNVVGLSALLIEYQWLTWLVRVLGGSYLIYLGIRLLLTKP